MRWGYLGGAVLFAAGIAVGLLLAVPPILQIGDRIEAFPKTRISEGAVQLQRREYDVYLEVPDTTPESPWTLTIRDAAGRDVPLRPASGSVTYSWSGRSGERVGKVRVTTPGRHLIRGTGPPDTRVVFADEVAGDVLKSVLGGVGAFFLFGAAAVVLIVVTAARRRPREVKRWP